jgi:hypothetical protein
MTRRALETTRPDRRSTAVVDPSPRSGAAAAPAAIDWPRIVAALAATDEDDLPVVGRLPA